MKNFILFVFGLLLLLAFAIYGAVSKFAGMQNQVLSHPALDVVSESMATWNQPVDLGGGLSFYLPGGEFSRTEEILSGEASKAVTYYRFSNIDPSAGKAADLDLEGHEYLVEIFRTFQGDDPMFDCENVLTDFKTVEMNRTVNYYGTDAAFENTPAICRHEDVVKFLVRIHESSDYVANDPNQQSVVQLVQSSLLQE